MKPHEFRELVNEITRIAGLYGEADQLRDRISAVLGTAIAVKEGNIVVTKNENGQIVAVTRQNDEGRILYTISESALIDDAIDQDGILLRLGMLLGAMSRKDNHVYMVSSLVQGDLNPEYITALRDKLTLVLQDAGIEHMPR
jgi:nitrate reductase NapAB chaperone NapD